MNWIFWTRLLQNLNSKRKLWSLSVSIQTMSLSMKEEPAKLRNQRLDIVYINSPELQDASMENICMTPRIFLPVFLRKLPKNGLKSWILPDLTDHHKGMPRKGCISNPWSAAREFCSRKLTLRVEVKWEWSLFQSPPSKSSWRRDTQLITTNCYSRVNVHQAWEKWSEPCWPNLRQTSIWLGKWVTWRPLTEDTTEEHSSRD